MIPLSQYIADGAGDDFTPLMALAARRAQVAANSPSAKLRPLKVLPKAPEPAAAPPVQAAPRPVTEPRVPLRELEAERAARAADRDAHEATLASAVERARAEAFEEGRAAGRQEGEAELAFRLDDQRALHAEALEAERGRWTAEQGDRLADLMILQVAILEEAVKASIANVLRPLALDVRQRQTLDEIAGTVKTIALDGSAYRIAASGPADLLAALEIKLGDDARLLSFTPDETKIDIRIDADATVIESRLSSWRSALDEALS
jgi:hypothetical protein